MIIRPPFELVVVAIVVAVVIVRVAVLAIAVAVVVIVVVLVAATRVIGAATSLKPVASVFVCKGPYPFDYVTILFQYYAFEESQYLGLNSE